MLTRPRPIPLLWRSSLRSTRLRATGLAALVVLVALVVAALTVACSSGGRYGYTRKYVPTADEKRMTADVRVLDPKMAQIDPENWQGSRVTFYMVVHDRRGGPAGAAYLTGRVHTRNEINTCANKFDDESCRVTIKPAGHETIHLVVRLLGDDDVGDLRVGGGSLLRVVGTVFDKYDETDGKPVIQAHWYRHWPIGYYAREGELRQY